MTERWNAAHFKTVWVWFSSNVNMTTKTLHKAAQNWVVWFLPVSFVLLPLQTACNYLKPAAEVSKTCTLQTTAQHWRLLHNTAEHCTTIQTTAQYCRPIHNTADHYTTLPTTAQHCRPLHNTADPCTTLHITAQHCKTLHNSADPCKTLQTTAQHCRPL